MQLRGRHWMLFWLALFLAVAGVVATRQSRAIALARELYRLGDQRRTAQATVAELERQISDASSRRVLLPKAASLGLHIPSDVEETTITVRRTADQSR